MNLTHQCEHPSCSLPAEPWLICHLHRLCRQQLLEYPPYVAPRISECIIPFNLPGPCMLISAKGSFLASACFPRGFVPLSSTAFSPPAPSLTAPPRSRLSSRNPQTSPPEPACCSQPSRSSFPLTPRHWNSNLWLLSPISLSPWARWKSESV